MWRKWWKVSLDSQQDRYENSINVNMKHRYALLGRPVQILVKENVLLAFDMFKRIPLLGLYLRFRQFSSEHTTSKKMKLFSVLQIGGGRNSHEALLKVAQMVIKESRSTRVQPFNEYRKRFNLKPYKSFQEFTGKQVIRENPT